MQQNSATLIYDLNTMKGTTESYLNQLPHVLGSDTKLLFRPKKYYSEQEQ